MRGCASDTQLSAHPQTTQPKPEQLLEVGGRRQTLSRKATHPECDSKHRNPCSTAFVPLFGSAGPSSSASRGTSPSSARKGGCVRKMPPLLIKITLFVTSQALPSSCLTAAGRRDCCTGGCRQKRGPRDFGLPSNTANPERGRAAPHPVPAGTRSLTSDTQAQVMLGMR